MAPADAAGGTSRDEKPEASADRTRTIHFGADAAGSRLDKALAGRLPEHSRTVVSGWIDAGLVSLDGRVVAGKTKLRGGETAVVSIPPPPPTELVPEDRPLAILYEDDALLAIDKPAGLTVHPGSGRHDGTLANALVFHLANLPTVLGSDRPGIVHRLDKDTSGVMLVAKTEAAHRSLSRQFAARTVHKEYVAVVHGAVEGESGRIDLPIGRSAAGKTKMAIRAQGGRVAVTDWRVEERLPRHTVVRCFPATGRTHQLRVHWRAQEHPIVRDPIYGFSSSIGDDLAPRLLLHAHRISFAHPTSSETMQFEAPLPADFSEALVALRALPAEKGRRRGGR